MEAKACCSFRWLQPFHSFLFLPCSKINPPTSRKQLSLLFLDTTSHTLPDIFYNKVMPLLSVKELTLGRSWTSNLRPGGKTKTHTAPRAFSPDEFSPVPSADCCSSQLNVPACPELLHKELRYSGLWFPACSSFLPTLCSSAEHRGPEAPSTHTNAGSSQNMKKLRSRLTLQELPEEHK